jgi:hypothetical protein
MGSFTWVVSVVEVHRREAWPAGGEVVCVKRELRHRGAVVSTGGVQIVHVHHAALFDHGDL